MGLILEIVLVHLEFGFTIMSFWCILTAISADPAQMHAEGI